MRGAVLNEGCVKLVVHFAIFFFSQYKKYLIFVKSNIQSYP